MTLEKADKGLRDVVKYVGSKKDNVDFPFEVEKILILPTGKTSLELIDRIRMINSSSKSIAQVLKDEGFGNFDVDYFVYSGKEGESFSITHFMPLNDYIALI
ncbi:MAG TPA: hypothetical protein VIJ75_12505 [Hanamia sp.]